MRVVANQRVVAPGPGVIQEQFHDIRDVVDQQREQHRSVRTNGVDPGMSVSGALYYEVGGKETRDTLIPLSPTQ